MKWRFGQGRHLLRLGGGEKICPLLLPVTDSLRLPFGLWPLQASLFLWSHRLLVYCVGFPLLPRKNVCACTEDPARCGISLLSGPSIAISSFVTECNKPPLGSGARLWTFVGRTGNHRTVLCPGLYQITWYSHAVSPGFHCPLANPWAFQWETSKYQGIGGRAEVSFFSRVLLALSTKPYSSIVLAHLGFHLSLLFSPGFFHHNSACVI